MPIYLPVAEISVNGGMIIALGALVGFLSGVFGVGGGFMTTPFLIFMGIPPAVAVGTQANQLVASSVSGVLSHWRRGNVDPKIGLVMLAGGMIGTLIGIVIFKLLQVLGQIDLVISLLYVILLGVIGGLMLWESTRAVLTRLLSASQEGGGKASGARHKMAEWAIWDRLPYKMRFPRSRLYVSALLPGGIGLIGGILVSILGIGGGFVMVPMMIYFLGMPTLLVAGTSLFQITFTTAFSALLHATANQTVDVILALLLIIGSVIGVQAGAAASRHLRGETARFLLALMVFAVALRLAFGLVAEPEALYTLEVMP